jgi:site-specific recombinase XerC
MGRQAGQPATRRWLDIHSLRHRFASRAHRVNRDLADVQDLLGHASPATTRIYVATDDAERRRIIEAIAS